MTLNCILLETVIYQMFILSYDLTDKIPFSNLKDKVSLIHHTLNKKAN